jgi:hypothetical protein
MAIRGSYAARFTDVNDQYERYLIVCVDKTWGQPGCQPWTGDWVTTAPGLPGYQVTSPYFTPSTVLTAVTSSDVGYYYQVQIIDSNGNVVKTCNYVDRHHPCYYYVSASPTPTPSVTVITPTPTVVTPTPTPTVVTPTVTVPVGVPAVSPVPTTVTPTPTSPKVSKTMIGVIAGGIGLATLGIGLYFALRRRKKMP